MANKRRTTNTGTTGTSRAITGNPIQALWTLEALRNLVNIAQSCGALTEGQYSTIVGIVTNQNKNLIGHRMPTTVGSGGSAKLMPFQQAVG